MPRALLISRTLVSAAERDTAIRRIQARHGHYRAARCNHWVFEDARLPGDFTEFAEAPDPETLAAAHASAPDPVPGGDHVLHEVAL